MTHFQKLFSLICMLVLSCTAFHPAYASSLAQSAQLNTTSILCENSVRVANENKGDFAEKYDVGEDLLFWTLHANDCNDSTVNGKIVVAIGKDGVVGPNITTNTLGPEYYSQRPDSLNGSYVLKKDDLIRDFIARASTSVDISHNIEKTVPVSASPVIMLASTPAGEGGIIFSYPSEASLPEKASCTPEGNNYVVVNVSQQRPNSDAAVNLVHHELSHYGGIYSTGTLDFFEEAIASDVEISMIGRSDTVEQNPNSLQDRKNQYGEDFFKLHSFSDVPSSRGYGNYVLFAWIRFTSGMSLADIREKLLQAGKDHPEVCGPDNIHFLSAFPYAFPHLNILTLEKAILAHSTANPGGPYGTLFSGHTRASSKYKVDVSVGSFTLQAGSFQYSSTQVSTGNKQKKISFDSTSVSVLTPSDSNGNYQEIPSGAYLENFVPPGAQYVSYTVLNKSDVEQTITLTEETVTPKPTSTRVYLPNITGNR